MAQKSRNTASATELFHPVEYALLADYFEVSRPECARGIDIHSEAELEPLERNSGVVRLRRDDSGNLSEFVLPNAVARIALNAIENRLPQWAVSYHPGELIFARQHNKRRRQGVTLLPQFLFQLNWADSGPGYSWPETYSVTFVPVFDRYVVTVSGDCPDAYGYEDIAIGHFGTEEEIEAGCRRVIVCWWKKTTESDPERRWQYFWDEGLIGVETAHRWGREVWGPSDDDYRIAGVSLGFWEQNGADVTRDSLIEYAIQNDYVWALEDFLDRHGWLDDDWEWRLENLAEK